MTGNIKHIVIIQSLQNEQPTGLELYTDIVQRKIDYKGLDFTHRYFDVNTKNELLDLLNHFADNAEFYEEGILIHFEMHGDEAQEGLVLKNKELIKWDELTEQFLKINIRTKNSLYLSMATCYGRYLYLGIDPYRKSPYAAFISASKQVSSLQIANDFNRLFDHLLDCGNLIESYLEMEKLGTEFYYKDSKTTFEVAFASVFEKLHGDMALKKTILDEARETVYNTTAHYLTDEDCDAIFYKALLDIYNKQQANFQF